MKEEIHEAMEMQKLSDGGRDCLPSQDRNVLRCLCPPDQLQLQGVHDPRRTQIHPTSRTARDPTATAPVRIRAARDPIEAARVPIVSKLEVHSWWSGFFKQLN
ncbi:hypothetical protein F2Q70_00003233 [Brassica cretica]|uniref:Uncharacterized protein n=1 Tax=Brassica cretica TaxID=69181 RepID=A0A8S9J1Y4_BRACR|nr:hypothetical protein F2Q70_00003233 [Brassica cretica]